ncbi:hypothetical protein [Dyella mobilis]|uniref:Uncharacterized protein n=1 Tax=Dyella mobilis TaxID=1849582 RepID=A0ABS2KMN4_9GAMM|nr:hypothetical protein [Dyella mobilis]MBM7132414.1 hypothetical protein [Dyella mobilis]GLQ95598.1 hypothetical protein GCM10007863_00160 [Dyella mobilis]
MHVDIPKLPMDSFKDLAKHYLMIVLGILTALGLEAWIEHAHHVSAAADASAQFDQQLRVNLDNIRRSIQRNTATMQKLDSLDAMVTADLQKGVPSAQINQQLRARRDDFKIDIQTPDTPVSAWDVAVANQSVSWIAPSKLSAYSTAYADIRAIGQWRQHGAFLMLDLPQTMNVITDMSKGQDVDPMQFLRVLAQLRGTLHSADSNLVSVQEDLLAALPDQGKSGAQGQ